LAALGNERIASERSTSKESKREREGEREEKDKEKKQEGGIERYIDSALSTLLHHFTIITTSCQQPDISVATLLQHT
jgi:hypothetical protein